jgi:hypothetical protein
MAIYARVEGEDKGEPLGIEGPVKVNGNTIIVEMAEPLSRWLQANPDKPVSLSKEPGEFPIAVYDETAPGGLTLADTITIYPPIKLQTVHE